MALKDGMQQVVVLYEDNHLLAVNKPAGLLAQADRTGALDLLTWAKEYRKAREQKPGNVFVGLVHRLDRSVSGVMVLAKTSKSANRLTQQFRDRRVSKLYLALVAPTPTPVTAAPMPIAELGSGTWQHFLSKEAARNVVHVSPATQSINPSNNSSSGDGNLLFAETAWQYLGSNSQGRERTSLLLLQPRTGRPHQLRVQTAASGWTILGDRKYGNRRFWPAGMALHAWRLTILHPTQQTPLMFEAPLPASWQPHRQTWIPPLLPTNQEAVEKSVGP